jgi:hypothetical protein
MPTERVGNSPIVWFQVTWTNCAPYTSMKSAVAIIAASASRSSQARAAGPTASVSICTQMWTLARYAAAPPMNENSTMASTENGSGQLDAEPIT